MSNRIKIILVVILVLFSGVAVGAGLYLMNRPQVLDTDAAGTTSLYFSDPTPAGPQQVGTNFTIDVLLDTKTDVIAGVDAIINFDPEYFEVVELSEGSSRFTSYPVLDFDNTRGEITIGANVGAASAVSGNSIIVATITFTPLKPVAQTSLSFDFTPDALNDSNAPAFVASGEEPHDLLAFARDAFIEIADTSEPITLSLLNLTPDNPQTVGSNFSFDIIADTGGLNVSGVDALLTFNPSLVEVITVEEASPSAFSSYPSLTYDNLEGTIRVSANIGVTPNAQAVNGSDLTIATITMQPLVEGDTEIGFDFTPNSLNDSNIVKYLTTGQESEDLLTQVNSLELSIIEAATGGGGNEDDDDEEDTGGTGGTNPTPTPTPTPTISINATPTPTPTIQINPTPTPANTTSSFTSPTATPDNTINGQEPLPEALPETASPAQTAAMIVVGLSLIIGGALITYGNQEK